jgi:PAS domain S-box-containing protein
MIQNKTSLPAFLQGNEEMARLIREKDWSHTSVGPIESWPNSLLTALGIIVKSKFPMFLFWGPELVGFYNDAYRPSLGNDGKHPNILGMPGQEAWHEIWHIIKPLIDKVLTEETATWHEDELVPIYRNGQLEEVYWTFSYSPVYNESGKPYGVFVTVTETTQKVVTQKKLQLTGENLKNLFYQTPVAIIVYKGPTYIIELINGTALEIWGKQEADLIGKPIGEVSPEINQLIAPLLTQVMQSGETLTTNEMEVPYQKAGELVTAYFDLVLRPIAEEGHITGVMAVFTDVTHSVLTRKAIEQNEQFNHSVLESNPDCLKVLNNQGIVTYINKNGLHIKEIADIEDVKGKYWWDLWGTTAKATIKAAFEKALQGETTSLQDFCITPKGTPKWWDVSVSPLINMDGAINQVIAVSRDITAAKKSQEDSLKMAQYLKLATESAEVGTWTLHMHNMDLEWSDLHKKMWGYSPDSDSLTYEDWHKIILPGDKEKAFEKVKEALENRTLYESVYRIQRPNDQVIRWIKSLGQYYYNDKGEPLILTGVSIDITKERLAEEKLMESEKDLRTMANSMPQLVWSTAPDGNIIFYNDRVNVYSGATQLPDGSWAWDAVVHPDESEDFALGWKKCLQTGEDFVKEHRLKMQNGDYRWMLTICYANRDKDGAINKWYGSSTDIHELKVHEKRKDEFIKMASHELKTPITSIKGYLQILQQKLQEEKDLVYQQILATLDRQVSKLTQLISDLLDVTRIESGGMVVMSDSFSLNELVKETVTDLQTIAKNHRLSFNEIDSIEIVADKERISQVLINLITNAIKYSPPKTAITISLAKQKDEAVLSVEDAGIGIDKAEQKRIFENFYRVSGKDEQTYPGFGIGLFIVKEIVTHHGGKIEVESEKNKGSIFRVRLPLTQKDKS